MRVGLLTVSIVAVLMSAGFARAQSNLERAIEAYESGELETAEQALGEVPQDSLSRDDVIQWLVYRALVAHVSGDAEELDASVLQLATLGENDPLGRRAPPPVRTAYENALQRVSDALSVDASASVQAGGVSVEARLRNDMGALIESIRVRARAPGGEWLSNDGEPRVFVPTTGSTVELIVEAIGPGGSVMASQGTDEQPHTEQLGGVSSQVVADDTSVTTDEAAPRNVGKIVGITLTIVAVLAGGAVLTYFLLRDDDGDHQIAPPVVVFP